MNATTNSTTNRKGNRKQQAARIDVIESKLDKLIAALSAGKQDAPPVQDKHLAEFEQEEPQGKEYPEEFLLSLTCPMWERGLDWKVMTAEQRLASFAGKEDTLDEALAIFEHDSKPAFRKGTEPEKIVTHAEKHAAEKQPIEFAKPKPAATFSLRSVARQDIDWAGKRGSKGLASCPAVDQSAVKVPVKEKIKGVEKLVEKTQYLDNYTRSVVGPLLVEKFMTVKDADSTHVSRGAKLITLAMVDEHGKQIGPAIGHLRLTTSKADSLMLEGEIEMRLPVEDATGMGTVVFSGTSGEKIYLMGKTFVRNDK